LVIEEQRPADALGQEPRGRVHLELEDPRERRKKTTIATTMTTRTTATAIFFGVMADEIRKVVNSSDTWRSPRCKGVHVEESTARRALGDI
jgi:hypothetical protein